MCASRPTPPPRSPKHLSLALQGGGAHGAFTWGVMHRLMEDGRIFIDGISGASAGAINGAVFSDGFLKGGRKGAIDGLEKFWRQISQFSLLGHRWMKGMPTPAGRMTLEDTPGYAAFDFVTRMFSPYQFNPMGINPLRDVLDRLIDFEAIRKDKRLKLFVAATNVKSCQSRLFRAQELTADVLLASSCLPLVSPAVEINGESYWDGGYLGNPSIYPLIHECKSHDVLLVMINPLKRQTVPTSAREILNRITEIGFNATLISEMSNYAVISQLIEKGQLKSKAYSRVNFHLIEAPEELAEYSASSQLNTDWEFLSYLHDLGYKAAKDWLGRHVNDIGKKSTLDVIQHFMGHHV